MKSLKVELLNHQITELLKKYGITNDLLMYDIAILVIESQKEAVESLIK